MRRQNGLAGPRTEILDIGCSYGVLAALLRHDLSLDALYDHYGKADRSLLTREQTLSADRAFFAGRRTLVDLGVTGLDRATRAVGYATEVGLLDVGIGRDLESTAAPAKLTSIPALDLVVSTGCVGYVGSRTFERLLSSLPKPYPWIACFVLRMFDYAPIAETLLQFGFRTRRVEGVSVRQRRFVSVEEQSRTIASVHRLGHSTIGREDTGLLFADLFVSLPSHEHHKFDGAFELRRVDALAE